MLAAGCQQPAAKVRSFPPKRDEKEKSEHGGFDVLVTSKG